MSRVCVALTFAFFRSSGSSTTKLSGSHSKPFTMSFHSTGLPVAEFRRS